MEPLVGIEPTTYGLRNPRLSRNAPYFTERYSY
jgi:hypothetical protein